MSSFIKALTERNVGKTIGTFSDRVIVSAENKIELRINSRLGDVYLLLSKNDFEFFIEDLEEVLDSGKVVGNNYEISFKKNEFIITSFTERKEYKFIVKEDSLKDKIPELISALKEIYKKL